MTLWTPKKPDLFIPKGICSMMPGGCNNLLGAGGESCTTDNLITPAGQGNTYSSNRAGGTIANATDGSTSTIWNPTDWVGDHWFKCEFPSANLITRMSFHTGNGGDWGAGGRVEDEIMQGSNNDSDWDNLNNTGGGTYSTNTVYNRDFASNTTAYKYLRWYLDMNEYNGENHDWRHFYAYCTF